MAYEHTNSKGKTYHLNSKDVTLKSTGRVQSTVQINRRVKTVETLGDAMKSYKYNQLHLMLDPFLS